MTTVAEARMTICNSCEHFRNILKVCKLCGCFMPAKTMISGSYCPDTPPRWIAVNDPSTNPDCNSCSQKETHGT